MNFKALVAETHAIHNGKVLCPVHVEKTPSVHVYDDHGHCFGCGKHFDAIAWLMAVRGMDFKAARKEADQRGLHAQGRMDFNAKAPKPATTNPTKPPPQTEGQRDKAQRIWADAVDAKGTLAEAYLRRRAIPRAPASARFHPSLYKPELEANLPAIVYGVTNGEGELLAVQVAWLNPDGTREQTGVAKRTYGSVRGGSMKIGTPSACMVVCEGPETAMSAAILFGCYAEAVMGSSNIAHWQPPEVAWCVATCPDNDHKDDSAAVRAFCAKGRELQDQGFVVSAQGPNRGKSDWNDVLMENPRKRIRFPESRDELDCIVRQRDVRLGLTSAANPV